MKKLFFYLVYFLIISYLTSLGDPKTQLYLAGFITAMFLFLVPKQFYEILKERRF